MNRITTLQALDYEIRSSPFNWVLQRCLLPSWATAAAGSYYAWKVNRKMARYQRYRKQ